MMLISKLFIYAWGIDKSKEIIRIEHTHMYLKEIKHIQK